MNKSDWLHLFLKALGIYMVVTHIATFLTTSLSLVMVLTQQSAAQLTASRVYLWQGPVVSAISVAIGLVLIMRAKPLVAWALRDDKSKKQS